MRLQHRAIRITMKGALTTLTGVLLAGTALAGPSGGVVTHGGADIVGQGSDTVTINQNTNRVVINWQNFDTQAHESVTFNQIDSNSIALNRILSGSPTQFDGALNANGTVIMMNGNGVVFGNSARVDVNGLIATTVDVNTDSFMNDAQIRFDQSTNPNAAIINHGTITAKEAGLVGFVAPHVENSGTINARLGKVQLESGDRFTFDLYGDGLIEIAASDAVNAQLVKNSGTIKADGGVIQLQASAAKNVVDALVSNTGILEARSAVEKNGMIILGGYGHNAVQENKATDKKTDQGARTLTYNSGIINASGLQQNQTGGEIDLFGDMVVVDQGSLIMASGDAGGGNIRIGGDYLGGGDTPSALMTYIDRDSLILNDAITDGNGGRTIVWSDDTTIFHGNIFARGGVTSGNGGFVETSGKKNLDAQGYVDLTAPNGNKGTYLLDPDTITIYGDVDPTFTSTDGSINLADNQALWLDAADVSKITLTYSNDGISGITANGASGTNTITLSAGTANLAVGARIRLTASGAIATADTLGADTYTIAGISGNTITTVEILTQNYNAAATYRGLVSSWIDKSGNNNHAEQATHAAMPMWISDGLNGAGAIKFDGLDKLIAADSASLDLAGVGLTFFGTANNASPTAGTSGILINKENTYEMAIFNGRFQAAIGTVAAGGWVWGGTTAITNGNWNLLGFQHNNTQWNFYNNNLNTQTIAPAGAQTGNIAPTNNPLIIGDRSALAQRFTGLMADIILYDAALSLDSIALVDQYRSAKHNMILNAPGSGATEAARAMASTQAGAAADGYNVFTTRYLERLSETADVVLHAGNVINLDFQGDTLALDNNRSISLTTDTGNINTLSDGTIHTSGTGNIAFDAGNNIAIAHDFDLSAIGTGDITFTAAGGITVHEDAHLTASGGDVTINAVNGIETSSINAQRVFIRNTGASSDITIVDNAVLSASDAGDDAITLAAGRHVINQSDANALVTPNGHWRIFSDNPTDIVKSGLVSDANRYGCTYSGSINCAGATTIPVAQNVFFYEYMPTLTITADDASRIYGNANPIFTATYSGLLTGDTVANTLSGTPALSTVADVTSAVGSYTMTVANGSLVSYAGYALDFVDGTLTITPRALTIAADSQSRMMSMPNGPLTYTLGGDGLVNGDVMVGSLATTASLNAPRGVYAITQGTLTPNNGNYQIDFTAGEIEVTASGTLPPTTEIGRDNSMMRPSIIDPNTSRMQSAAFITGSTAGDGLMYNVDISKGGINIGSVAAMNDITPSASTSASDQLMQRFYKVFFTKELLRQLGYIIH